MALVTSAAKNHLTECFICKKDYTDPRLLPCIHSFCLECLESRRETTTSAVMQNMNCPFCQKLFQIPKEGFVGLKKNFFLQRLVKMNTIVTSSLVNNRKCDDCLEDSELADNAAQFAVQYCLQCSQFLCKPCSRIHRRNKQCKDHRLVDLGTESMHVHELLKDSNNSGADPCDKHSEEQLQLFCSDCKKFACAICLDEDHRQHTIHSIKRLADDHQNQLRQVIDDVTNCVIGAEKKKQILLDEIARFNENTDKCEEKISVAIEDLKRLIDVQGKALMEELMSAKQRQLKRLQNEVEDLERHRNLLDHFKTYCSEMVAKSTKTDLCNSFSDLSRRAKELQIIHDSELHTLTYFLSVFFEKSQTDDQMSVAIVGKLKETVELFDMPQDILDQTINGSANDGATVSDCEHSHMLEPFMQDLQVREKPHEKADTMLEAAEVTVQVSKGSLALNEQIASTTEEPRAKLKQTSLNTNDFHLEPFIEYTEQGTFKKTDNVGGYRPRPTFDELLNNDEQIVSTTQEARAELKQTTLGTPTNDFHMKPSTEYTEPDSVSVPCHFPEFVYESFSDENETKGTFEITNIVGECTFDEYNNDYPACDVIDRSSIDFNPFGEEVKQGFVIRNFIEENVGDITMQKNSSSSQPVHSGFAHSVTHSVARIYNDNSPKEALEIISMPDVPVTDAFSEKMNNYSDWLPESRNSNNFHEVSQNFLKSLENSSVQRSKGDDVIRPIRKKRRVQGLSDGQCGAKQMNIKGWLMQTREKPEGKLNRMDKTELSVNDLLPNLYTSEAEQPPSCDPIRSKIKEAELCVQDETSCLPCFDHFILRKYVNTTSEIGLELVMKQVSEAGPSLSTDKTLVRTKKPIKIHPTDSIQRSKRKLTTSKPKESDKNSKRCKGVRSLELLHKIKYGSCEIFGATYLQDKIYVLRKKSVIIYSIQDPRQQLDNIKLQNAITPFDICACKQSFAIYVTDFGNYNKDGEKHCIWKITAGEHKISRWYCGIGEPHTLSVNSAGNIILLRIEADGQQMAIEIFSTISDKAELIHRIILPDEIKNPEHAVETSIGSYVICHKHNGYNIWTVSEVSSNGEIVRRLKGTEQLNEPKHLAVDAEDRVFVADWRNSRVAILETSPDWVYTLFNVDKNDKDEFKKIHRLCYVPEKNQLIVVCNSLKVYVYRVVLS